MGRAEVLEDCTKLAIFFATSSRHLAWQNLRFCSMMMHWFVGTACGTMDCIGLGIQLRLPGAIQSPKKQNTLTKEVP